MVVTFGVGAAVANEITNDFQYMGQPFLMGTVALGKCVGIGVHVRLWGVLHSVY